METSHQQPLSIESFSYSWLVNLKPSLEGFDSCSLRGASIDACDEANSFIEMDPTMPPSKRFIRNSQDFRFDFPIYQSPLALVHADQLFANGYVTPRSIDPLKMEAFEASSDSSPVALPATTHYVTKLQVGCGPGRNLTSCSSLRRKCRKLSKRLFRKYLDFLVKPLYRRTLRGGRSSTSRADHHDHHNGDSRVYVVETSSPRISVAYSADDWRKSCDSESSIHEAVLHCKRSIGK